MVTDTDYLVSYDGRNDTGPYAIDFDVQVDAGGNAIDIKVYLVDADGVQTEITDDCTITGLNVYTTESYDDTYTVIIVRDPDPTQPYALPYGSKLPSKTIENALDRLAFLIQKVLIKVDRSLRFPLSEAAVGDLPTVAELTGKVLGLDAEGAFAAYAGVPSVPATAAAATLLDDETVAAMRTTLNLPIKAKVLTIGDWDMDETLSVSVAHGVDVTKIVGVLGVIIPDDSPNTRYPFGGFGLSGGTASLDVFVDHCDATNVVINRKASGTFDSVEFNATSFNRGYVLVLYVD